MLVYVNLFLSNSGNLRPLLNEEVGTY